MALSRAASALFRQNIPSSSSSLIPMSSFPLHSSSSAPPNPRFSPSASISTQDSNTPPVQFASPIIGNRWKPMCLYYTQGRCTMMNDPMHLEKFNHSCLTVVKLNTAEVQSMRPQLFDFFLVLDLEGKEEILEFPVLMIDPKTMGVVDFFHRFVRPSRMSEERINQYIAGKYGKFGVDRVWHDTAIPFKEVIEQFEDWMVQNQLLVKDQDGLINKAAFVTCGNWDLKTKVPEQCTASRMKLPRYFTEWVNLKDVYLNFYNKEARGMRSMMNQLRIPMLGSHHLGIDDTKNIARVLLQMLSDGAILQITARRNPNSPGQVQFLFKNRI